jgi:hypothetical protein
LIEPALPFAPPVQRHRHDDVETLFPRKNPRKKTSQRPTQWLHSIELEQVNELAEATLVCPGRVDLVEPVQSKPAQWALAGVVQRIAIQERRPAGAAKELGIKRGRLLQAIAAYRNTREFVQRSLTNSAFVGENKVEKTASYPDDG